MSSNPPRRPPGPPPARPPPGEGLPGGIKRPPGPPSSSAPVAVMKPPPSAPPPLVPPQNIQRPPVESLKRPPPPQAIPQNMPPPKPATPLLDDNAAPKPAGKAPPGQKEGAISMFEEDTTKKTQQAPPPSAPGARPFGAPPRAPPRAPPAGPDPMAKVGAPRQMRPPPPRSAAIGIPDGQPLPPGVKPLSDAKPPAPSKPPPLTPEGGRAPPKEDPEVELMRKRQNIAPPTTEPPLLRVKKPKEEKVIKRREKDMPEYESSDEDEEPPQLVKQPLPFGVLKGEIPPLKKAEEDEVDDQELRQQQAEKNAKLDERSLTSTQTGVSSAGRLDRGKSVRLAKPKEVVDAPSVAPKDIKKSDFVPKPPLDMDKHFDDSSLGKILTRGRLSIKCVEGIDIRRKDDQDKFPRNDPFLKFRLGVAERLPWKTTETKRKQDSNPKFDNEIVFFDVVDPAQYILDEDVQLCVELWNNSITKNELVGSVTMSIVRFFKQPFVSYTEKIPIYYPGMTRTSMRLILEIVFEEARSGLAQITVYEAIGIRNIDPLGKQDPYVQFSLGRHYKKRTKSVKGGGVNPYFNEEEVLLWLDQDNWVEDLKVEVLDEDAKEERPIGSTHFSLLPYMKRLNEVVTEESYDLFYYMLLDPKDDTEKKEVACGQIIIRVKFYQSGKLKVLVDRAKDLQFPENLQITRFDPYAQLTIDGKAVQVIKRTPADKDGGKDPIWQNEIQFDIVDQYMIDLKVFNQNITGKDTLLGFAEISLLSVFRNGQTEFWTSLKQKRVNGGIKEVGDIYIKLFFNGPVGIAYPQFRDGEVDTFDDTLRKLPPDTSPTKAVKAAGEVVPDDEDEIKATISTIPSENEKPVDEQLKDLQALEEKKRVETIPQEFTDEEIIAAFRFIDLDHNNFVGAAEIRHILVCMGEMITDEEIDMMISMVDLDGDGQVSFKEFRTLVLHPNPAIIDMHKEINTEKENELMKDKQALAGKNQSNDLESFQRQKELLQRETKKKYLQPFIVDNEITFDTIKQSYYDFIELPIEKRSSGSKLKFNDFCKIMKIEPITEYKNMHNLYDNEETGELDIKEFLLSLMNFIPIDKELRIKFSFEMFDDTKSGFITRKEIEEILRGNHMLSLNSVKRKAETIMRQAHTDDHGQITLKEFLIVSKKFPNILFPTSGITTGGKKP